MRKYYHYDKLDELGFDETHDKEKDRPIKCVFTKKLRRQKLFAYVKYFNGKKVLFKNLLGSLLLLKEQYNLT